MKGYLKATTLILSQLGSLPLSEAALKIGDVVCITGYVIDKGGLQVLSTAWISLDTWIVMAVLLLMDIYQATVMGTVSDLGDGSTDMSGAPMLTNFEMRVASWWHCI